MKRLLGSLFILALAVPPATAQQGQSIIRAVDDYYEITIDETKDGGLSLEAFIKICQQNTGLNFTYTKEDGQTLQDRKVRMFGTKRIPKERFYSFFQTMMKIHNFACVELGRGDEKIVVVTNLQGPQKNTVIANAVFLDDPSEVERYAHQPGVLVTTVFTLKYQEAQRLSANLRQYFVDQTLEKIIGVGRNGLLVQSFGPTVAAMKRLITLLDVPPDKPDPPVLEVVPLEFAAAEEIEPLLGELIERRTGTNPQRRSGGRGASGGDIQSVEDYEIKIISDPRTNSLLVQASKSDMDWVLELIHRLDTKLEAPDSNFKVYQVKNVSSVDLADNLQRFLDLTQQSVREAQTQGNRGGSGNTTTVAPENELKPVIIADEQTNSLMITASKTKWQEIKFLLEQLDVRQPQVLIETALVELTTDDLSEIGVELAKISGSSFPEDGDSGKPGIATGFGLSEIDDLDGDGFPESRNPVAGGSLPLQSGLLAGFITGEDIGMPVILAAIKETGNANILSIPSVLVTNNVNASIVSETQFQTTQRTDPGSGQNPTVSAGATVAAGITLNISPSISAANYLRLNIDLEISSFTETPSAGSATAPPTNLRHMQTSVYVPNGSTLYIGGVNVDEFRESRTGIPILSDIPIIGILFSRTSNQANKTTLYFFITPRIINQEDFSDLLALSYDKKLEADSIIGHGRMNTIDPNFRPLMAPGEGVDIKELESTVFDIPLYNSPDGGVKVDTDRSNGEKKEE